MHLTITLETDVPDLVTALDYVSQVKTWLATHPVIEGRAYLATDLTDELVNE